MALFAFSALGGIGLGPALSGFAEGLLVVTRTYSCFLGT
jgi:hypothetical protein